MSIHSISIRTRWYRQSIVLGVALLLHVPLAHAKDAFAACAFEIESQASRMQACLVIQETEHQCDEVIAAFHHARDACLAKKMPLERAAMAQQVGEGKIKGDPKDSPWQRKLAIDKAIHDFLGENRYRYETTFQGQFAPPDMLNADFHSDACPLAFTAAGQKKWVYRNQLVVFGNAELDLPLAPKDILPTTHLWFTPMQPGKCYRPGSTDLVANAVEFDEPEFIYNLPDAWLQGLNRTFPPRIEKQLRGKESKSAFRLKQPLEVEVEIWDGPLKGVISVHRCLAPDLCDSDIGQFRKNYEDYATALQTQARARKCLDYLQPNARGEIDINTLFEFECTEENGKQLLADGEKQLARLRDLLFAKPQ